MSATAVSYTREELIDAAKAYQMMSRKRPDTESYLKAIQHWEPTVVTAALDEIERQLSAAPAAIAVGPVATATASITFFESIALPLVERLNAPVAPCYPNDKQVHTKLVPSPLTMKSKDPAQIHAWGLAEPNANVCVYAEQKP